MKAEEGKRSSLDSRRSGEPPRMPAGSSSTKRGHGIETVRCQVDADGSVRDRTFKRRWSVRPVTSPFTMPSTTTRAKPSQSSSYQHCDWRKSRSTMRTFLTTRVGALAAQHPAIKAFYEAAQDYEADLVHLFSIDDLWLILKTCQRIEADDSLADAIEAVRLCDQYLDDKHRMVFQLCDVFPERVESLAFP